MPSYHRILYHLIFRTKGGRKAITPEHSRELYAYIIGIIKNKNCFLYRINGMEDHIHIFSDLHPSVSLAVFMRDIKSASSIWMKKSGKFPDFSNWGVRYAALTYAWADKDRIVDYIKYQQQHHKKESFEDELRRLLKEQGIDIDEKYFPLL